jgi:hypothetical protein
MKNKGKPHSEELRIQGLLDRYLNRQAADNRLSTQDNHLDEDSLAAFVEGNLSQRESTPIISHLVDCTFCRHVTAELVRLDLAFADVPLAAAATEKQPSKVSEVLSGILSRIFGTNDSAVFAHHQKEEEDSEKTDAEEKRKE